MANADKCHLLIPYKDATREADPSSDIPGQLDWSTYASQMFQNFKAIENRINDPDCQSGGGACGCASVTTHTHLFDPDTVDADLAIGDEKFYKAFVDERNTGDFTTDFSAGTITPSTSGLYRVTITGEFVHKSGSDVPTVIIATNTPGAAAYNPPAQYTFWPPASWTSNMFFTATTENLMDANAGDYWTAYAASVGTGTRVITMDGVGIYAGGYLSFTATKICGCDDLHDL